MLLELNSDFPVVPLPPSALSDNTAQGNLFNKRIYVEMTVFFGGENLLILPWTSSITGNARVECKGMSLLFLNSSHVITLIEIIEIFLGKKDPASKGLVI